MRYFRNPYLLSVLLIFQNMTGISQNLVFDWVKQMTGQIASPVYNHSSGEKIITDASGNIYMVGFFEGTVDFDPGPLNHILTSFSNSDCFVSKFDASGNLIWVKQMGGIGGTANGTSIARDASGNIYVNGFFEGDIDFDPGPGSFILSATGNDNSFITKLDPSGNFIWAKKIEGSSTGNAAALYFMTADAAGNCYLTGHFSGTVDFDPGSTVYNMISIGLSDIALCKLDPSGNFLWAKQKGNTNRDESYSIVLDPSGNIIIAGLFNGDPGGADGNAFLLKYDPSGDEVWMTQSITSNKYQNGGELAVDPNGNIYCTGVFYGQIGFTSASGTVTVAAGTQTNFVAGFDAAGNALGIKSLGDQSGDKLMKVIADPNGNIFLCGFVSNHFLDNVVSKNCIQPTTIPTSGNSFILKLDAVGNFTWVKEFSKPAINSIALDPSGNLYSTGAFEGTVDFDPGPATFNLTATNSQDIFLGKLGHCTGATYSSLTVSACSNYVLNCFPYNSSGIYTQIIPNATGCDSVISLNLSLSNNTPATVLQADVCDRYVWNNKEYTSSGLYPETLKTTGGCDSVVILQLTIRQKSVTGFTRTICQGESFEGYSVAGNYTDMFVSASGCDSIRNLQLLVAEPPEPNLGTVKELCPGDTLVLNPGNFTDYTWQDGSKGSRYTVRTPGQYTVSVANQCGSAQAGVVVKEKVCDIIFPNAFSPNNNGVNETFKILHSPQLTGFTLSIYNRWGQKVFETKDYTQGWNGKTGAEYAVAGVYIWICNFIKAGETKSTQMKGTVVLIR